jgi:hypothetical protein
MTRRIKTLHQVPRQKNPDTDLLAQADPSLDNRLSMTTPSPYQKSP